MKMNFTNDEQYFIKQQFIKYKDKDNDEIININNFMKNTFINLPISMKNILSFLDDYYKTKNSIKLTKSISLDEYNTLIYILTKSTMNSEEPSMYKKSTFDLVYEIFKGKIGSSKENYYDFEVLKVIFEMVVDIYVNRHEKKDLIYNNCDKDKFNEFLINSLMDANNFKNTNKSELFSKGVERTLVIEFLKKLVNLDSFLRSHFRLQMMGLDVKVGVDEKLQEGTQIDNSIFSILPIYHSTPSNISTEVFLFFLLSNPHICDRKKGYSYAFKLFDNKKDGFCIFSAAYSFIGFSGPVAIFITHYDSEENREYILGGFINSNINENRYCGDEKSYLFSLFPVFKNYIFAQNKNKIAYFGSKYSHLSEKKPGIGFGEYHDKFRLWVDSNDTTHRSYMLKFDDVFEDGSPFQDAQKFLNIVGIEIFGFGNEEDFDNLIKKQGKDKILISKMKKIDKKLLVENEFDKDILLSDTFSHQRFGHTSNMDS